MTMRKPSSDTAHLYDGKVVRSSAPSRKKAAGQAGIGSEIPKDAIPELEMPSFIESLIGGPIVPKMKFLPPDKFVQNMQLGVYVILVGLALLTYIISPPKEPFGSFFWEVLISLCCSKSVSSLVLQDLVSGVLTSETLATCSAPICCSFLPSCDLHPLKQASMTCSVLQIVLRFLLLWSLFTRFYSSCTLNCQTVSCATPCSIRAFEQTKSTS